MNWILSRFCCIPIKRKEDVGHDDPRNNEDAFLQCYTHFENSGILFVAPEGVSWMDRIERPFKTGTARIVFGAQQKNNWNLDLIIFPVGLTYTAPNLFRSTVYVNYGKPITTKDWENAWKEDQELAVDRFTQMIQDSINDLRVYVPDELADKKLAVLEQSAQAKNPISVEARYERLKALSSNQNLLDTPTDTVINKPVSFGFTDWILLPFAILGYVFWFVPCYLPMLLAQKLNLYIGYDSNVKLIAGIFTFSGWICAYFAVFQYFISPEKGLAWLVFGLVVGSGYAFDRVFWRD